MTSSAHVSKSHHAVQPTTHHAKEKAMSTKATKSTSTAHTTINPSETNQEVPMISAAHASPSIPASIAATPIVATSAPAGTPAESSATTTNLSPPPDISVIPSPPDDFVAPTPGEFRVVAPRKSELAALPQAVTDARNFTQYPQLIGGNGPTIDEIVQSFDLARQWSTMRQASARWDAYCVLQEGLAWQVVRAIILHLGPAYSLALVLNPKLSAQLPGLTSLLQAKQTIAKKGVATRVANKVAKSKGEPENHGLVGKANEKRAAKEALAAAKAAAAATAAAPANPATLAIAATPAAHPAPVVTAPGATVATGAQPS